MSSRLSLAVFLTSVLAAGSAAAQSGYGFDLIAAADSGSSFISIQASSGSEQNRALWDSDPLSSAWTLNIDGVHVVPSESDWVREERAIGDVNRIIYSNRTVSFTQEAVVSGAKSHARISVNFTNNGTETIKLIPSLILDTSLGEANGLPFLLDDGSYPRAETYYEGSDIPKWIRTVQNSTSPSLTVVLDGKLPTRPESLVLANWMRLKQSAGDFLVEEGRSFDYLPFSEADSAMEIQYKSKNLSSGESYSVIIVVGLDENVPEPEAFDAVVETSVDTDLENLRLREYTIRQRLREIGVILDSMDIVFGGEGILTDDALAEIEQKVLNQEKLRAEYENL